MYFHLFQLMGEEPDLDPEITKDFFEQNILQLDPSLLTENGMKWVSTLEAVQSDFLLPFKFS